MILTGLTTLWIDGRMAVSPELDHQRAAFVLGKIDEILTWEQTKEQERDVRFVELGGNICARFGPSSTGAWKD